MYSLGNTLKNTKQPQQTVYQMFEIMYFHWIKINHKISEAENSMK